MKDVKKKLLRLLSRYEFDPDGLAPILQLMSELEEDVLRKEAKRIFYGVVNRKGVT